MRLPLCSNTGTAIKRYQDMKNCRALFMSFAKAKGFDPLSAANWYNIPSGQMRRDTVGLW